MSRWIFILFLAAGYLGALHSAVGAEISELYALYLERDFFTLAARLPDLDANEPRRAFFAGQVDAAFRRDAQAEQELGRFVQTVGVDGTWRHEALLTLGNSRLRRGEYAGAARALAEGLHEGGRGLSAARKADAEQNLIVARALRDVPSPTTSRRGPVVKLPVDLDKFGWLHVGLRINGHPERGMFDTLANGNVASETFARQHGLRMLAEPIKMEAITGQVFAARVGVADEVQIGGMSFRHVVFTILPSRNMTLAGSGEASSLIVGLPLILGLERMRYDATQSRLEVGLPGQATDGNQNLAFDGLAPLVRARYRGQSLPFVLDTGMQQTHLARRFGQRFPGALAGSTPRATRQRGVGSNATLQINVVPTLDLSAGGWPRKLRDVPALTADRAFLPPVFGALGADFCRDGFELDWRAMRFAVPRKSG